MNPRQRDRRRRDLYRAAAYLIAGALLTAYVVGLVLVATAH